MNRRNFLHRVSAAAVAGVITAAVPGRAASAAQPPAALPQGRAIGRLFRGSGDGRLLESADNGSTWQPLADFGSQCAVLAIVERQNQVVVKIGIGQYSFQLQSSDGRVWRTSNTLSKA